MQKFLKKLWFNFFFGSTFCCTLVYCSVHNDKYSIRLRNRILYSRLQAKQEDLRYHKLKSFEKTQNNDRENKEVFDVINAEFVQWLHVSLHNG